MFTFITSLFSMLKFGPIFNFLKENWQAVSLVLIIGGSFLYVKSLRDDIKDLNSQLTEEKVAHAMCENNNASLKQAINTQNKEIQKWTKVGRDSKQKFDELKTELEAKRQQAVLEVNKILQEKKPESCQEAINYLVDGKKDILWSETH